MPIDIHLDMITKDTAPLTLPAIPELRISAYSQSSSSSDEKSTLSGSFPSSCPIPGVPGAGRDGSDTGEVGADSFHNQHERLRVTAILRQLTFYDGLSR